MDLFNEMNTRSKFLAITLFEGIRLITEQDEMGAPSQAALPPQQQPQVQPPGTGDVIPSGPTDAPPGSPMGTDGKPLTVDSIIDKLNVIRGGKSFSDPEVYGQLTTMFKAMPDQEKLNLDQTLTKIGDTVKQQKEPTPGETTPQQMTSSGPQSTPNQAPQGQPSAAPVVATP